MGDVLSRENKKVLRSFGTHDGTFHADEVTACALLLLYGQIDKDKIFRTRDPKFLASCEFVCDVGGVYDPERKLFDHHQANYSGQLSSAGMVLEYLRSQKMMTIAEHRFFQQALIIGVDAHDNGVDVTPAGSQTYSNIISNFTPIHHDAPEEEQGRAFQAALDFAYSHLDRMKRRFGYIVSCRDRVEEAMQASRECLVFETSIPWMDSFFELGGENHPAGFVIMPSGHHWKLRGIPPRLAQKMKVRTPLPESWAGLIDEELKAETGIAGALFCHKGRFISVWETKEDALKALELVLRKGRSL
jgi:uncharacterized UPF0160 family protein